MRCILAVSVLSILGLASYGRGEPRELAVGNQSPSSQMLQRLRTEAVSQWQQMAHKLESCCFSYTIVETNRGDRVNLTRTKRVNGQVVNDCFLLQETIDSTAQVSVAARNHNYEFALARTGDAPWIITWQNARRDVNTPVGSASEFLAGMLQLPWSISGASLEKLITSPRFSLRGAKVGGDGSMQLDFKVQPTDEHPDPLQHLDSGSVVLDSTHHWAIKSYQVAYANKMVGKLQLTYGPSGPPELQRVSLELVQSPTTLSTFQVHSAHYDWNPPQQSDFTLSTFGLPEFREPGRSSRPKIFVNIGLVCLLAGLILYFRKHHVST